ncbi:MAG TPA: CHRD domain-containing protein [Candidatus Dormibacteraeota bacterium]
MTRWVALVALAVIVSACGSGGGTAAASPSPSPSPIAASPSPSPSPSGLSFKVTGADPTVTASGTATLQVQAGSVTLELAISGLQANSKHVSHIHLGSCQQRGSIAIGLNEVTADAQGNADTKTTITATYPPASGTWYVVVHAGPDMQGTNATYLLCGNLFA